MSDKNNFEHHNDPEWLVNQLESWDEGDTTASYLMKTAACAIRNLTLSQTEPSSPDVVKAPIIPTEMMWGGLARQIVMWMDMHPKTPRALFKHLENSGTPIPKWLRDEPELKHLDHIPSKGTRAVIIYRAMLEEIYNPTPQVILTRKEFKGCPPGKLLSVFAVFEYISAGEIMCKFSNGDLFGFLTHPDIKDQIVPVEYLNQDVVITAEMGNPPDRVYWKNIDLQTST